MQLPCDANFCPDCGYPLTGLDTAVHCPECGSEIDPEAIILWGRTIGITQFDLCRSRPTPVGWGIIVLVFVAAGILCFMQGGRRLASPMIACSIMIMVTLAMAYTERNDGAPAPRGKQLRLTPKGYGHRSGAGPIRLTPWSGGEQVSVAFIAPDRLGVRVSRGGSTFAYAIQSTGTTDDAAKILHRVSGWSAAASSASVAQQPSGRTPRN